MSLESWEYDNVCRERDDAIAGWAKAQSQTATALSQRDEALRHLSGLADVLYDAAQTLLTLGRKGDGERFLAVAVAAIDATQGART